MYGHMDEGWDERRDKMRDQMRDEMKDEMRDEMRQELRWDESWLMRWKKRWGICHFWYSKIFIVFLAQVTDCNWKAFIFPPAGATFDGKCSSIVTNRLYSNISQKKTSFINTMISNTVYSFEKHKKNSIFLCSRPKTAVFQIFQDRFFHGLLISIREGLLRIFIQVPPLFASKNHLSVS